MTGDEKKDEEENQEDIYEEYEDYEVDDQEDNERFNPSLAADERLESEDLEEIDKKTDQYLIKDKQDDALKVVETVFDQKTRLALVKLMEKGYFSKLTGAISTGKEANVYFAPTEDEAIAIKIFRVDVQTFKQMRPYIEGDFRFRRFKGSRTGFIQAWAKKEFKNLQRLHENDIPCPRPIDVERNILLMQYLGTENAVLPRLLEARIEKPATLYKQLMGSVKDMYRKAHLIHADLSEYNILFNQEEQEYYIIDLSQAVLWDHPRAEEFLLRDLKNINRFFRNQGVDIRELERVYKWITGDDPSPIILSEMT